MNPRPSRRARLAACLGAWLLFATAAAWAAEPVRIGVLAHRPIAQVQAQWEALAQVLKAAIPEHDFAVEALDYVALDAAIAAGRVDFVLTNPGHYVLISRRSGLSSPLATLAFLESGRSASNFGGVIVARADDSRIGDLKSLAGRRIAIPSTESLGGYQMQLNEMLLAGVSLPGERLLITTGMPHDRVVDAVLEGRADAGFLRSGVLESMEREGRVDASRLKVINPRSEPGFPARLSTRLYPEWPFVALPQVDERLARRVVAALFLIEPDSPAATAMRIRGFVIPADYQPVSDMLRALRLPPYDAAPRFTMLDVWARYRTQIVIALLLVALALGFAVRASSLNRRLRQARLRGFEQERRHREQLEATVEARTAELSGANRRLRATLFALEGVGTAVFVADTESGRFLYVNRQAVESLGHTRDELLAMRVSDVDIGVEDEAYGGRVAEIREKGAVRVQTVHRRRDGTTLPVEMSIHYQPAGDGDPDRLIAFAVDISERKAVERALRDAREAAEAAAVAKSSFLANMSHEIRTPLNGMIGLAHLMRRAGLDAAQAERLGKLEASADHLLGILNAILDLSKIDAGKFTLEALPLRVEAVVGSTVAMLEDRALAKGIRLACETGDLPRDLVGDPTRLQQALLNYATNAIKFTEKGSVTLRASLAGESDAGALVRFEVEDTGIGIDPAVFPRLFQAFEQGDGSATRSVGGTGLGLAITRRLAELMGGEAGARSTPGVGSVFWFTARLRRAPAGASQGAETVREDAAGVLRRDHTGARVLLVEDNAINREVAVAILEDAGLVVDAAVDGVEAVEMVQANPNAYRLVLMDMQMPRMDGLEATRAIRSRHPAGTLPIIAMTANAFSDDVARCYAAGMDDFVGKPVEPSRLYARLLAWLEKPGVDG